MSAFNIFSYKYLSQDQLRRLDTYKYAAIDTSPVSKYIMHPFWNFVVEFVPKNIAPNILTLSGFACTLATALLLTYYDYHFYASSDDMRDQYKTIPSIVWLICSLNLFLSHTLDGIDGKQARRTKAMGPLGELMDHGVDSWTTVFITMQVYSFFGSVDWSFGPYRMFFVFWSVFLSFYVTHWEKYNTGVLYLPWSYDFSQIFLVCCCLATYWKSYTIWKCIVPFIGLPCSQLFELILYFSIISTLPTPLYNIYTARQKGTSKYSEMQDIARPLFPVSLLFFVSIAWASFSKTDIINQDPRVYFFVVGTVFSNISVSIVSRRVTVIDCSGLRSRLFLSRG